MNYKYTDEILQKLQGTQLEMLRTFDAICKRHDITYFVVWGTALGAIRHKGFIPWDDDIDVGMMRDEYKKLLEVPKSEWDNLFLIDPSDDFGVHKAIYPRIYKTGTIFETEYHYKYSNVRNDSKEKYLPIWMDIFIYDRVPSEKWAKRKHRYTSLLKHFYYWSKCDVQILKDDPITTKFKCLVKKILFWIFNIIKTPERKIFKLYLKMLRKANGPLVACFELSTISRAIFEYDKLFPVKEVPFEDMMVPIPKNYDEMLHKMYGNYMQLPPEDKRINHPPAILDFGDGVNVIDFHTN